MSASAPAVVVPVPGNGVADWLAGFVTGGNVGTDALRAAVPVVLDTLAVTLAGGAEPAVRVLMDSLEPSHRGVASFWDTRRYRGDDAALLLGMASHVLDYDDVSMLAVCHPSAPVLSVLLATADRGRTPGRVLLEAFAIGTEVTVRLGQAMGFRHYALGFHATATLGTVGAAAACARLLGLDARRTRDALAIAASLASGLRANFGSMVKSLHVGLAAANGQKAARLAAAGIRGGEDPFTGEGYLHAMTGGQVSDWPADVALGRPFAIADPGFEQKRYPCCYMLHKIIEAVLALRHEDGVRLGALRSADVLMPSGSTKPLIHPRPRTGLNALFSAPYAVIAGLADGRIDLRSFTDPEVMRPEVQSRLADVRVAEDPAPPLRGADVGAAPVTVTLSLADGRSVSRSVTASPGSRDDPMTALQLRAKWLDCLRRARPSASDAELGALFEAGAALDSAPDIDGFLGRLAANAT